METVESKVNDLRVQPLEGLVRDGTDGLLHGVEVGVGTSSLKRECDLALTTSRHVVDDLIALQRSKRRKIFTWAYMYGEAQTLSVLLSLVIVGASIVYFLRKRRMGLCNDKEQPPQSVPRAFVLGANCEQDTEQALIESEEEEEETESSEEEKKPTIPKKPEEKKRKRDLPKVLNTLVFVGDSK